MAQIGRDKPTYTGAGATRVAVALEKTERSLEISVDDNGHGFNFAGTYTLEGVELLRLGPASLKRRARHAETRTCCWNPVRDEGGAEVPDSAAVKTGWLA